LAINPADHAGEPHVQPEPVEADRGDVVDRRVAGVVGVLDAGLGQRELGYFPCLQADPFGELGLVVESRMLARPVREGGRLGQYACEERRDHRQLGPFPPVAQAAASASGTPRAALAAFLRIWPRSAPSRQITYHPGPWWELYWS